jgi:hypothetical protein
MGPKTLPTIWGSYMKLVDLVDFYTHWSYILYMPIFSPILLSNYWWQKSDIWLQAVYRYPVSWEAFFDPSDSYFLFAEERGYHKWALAHSSSWWANIRCLPSIASEKNAMKNEHICSMCKKINSRQTGSRNLMGPKMLPTIWYTYMKLVTKYQISAINSYWEKCDEKWAYMFNV